MSSRPILLVDLFNLFTRQYAAHPDMSATGIQTGGIVGTLKAIARLTDQLKPKQVYIIWESGGSTRRKSILPEYKGNRNKSSGKLNRFYEGDIPDTDENKVWQIEMLAKALKFLPVHQIYVKNCEGDDVIAYLNKRKFQNDNCIILSGDKDFYQLLDDNTKIYDPAKKILIDKKNATLSTGISPMNFALAKAICGDRSDNIDGVRGVAFKSLKRLFPFLGLDQSFTIEDIVKQSAARANEGKGIRTISQSDALIRRNWKLVYLDTAMLSHDQIAKIDYAIETGVDAKIDKIGLSKFVTEHQLRSINVNEICVPFMCISKLALQPTGE